MVRAACQGDPLAGLRYGLTFRTPARSGQSRIELSHLSLVRRLAWLVRSPGRGECRERPGWPERPPSRQHQIRYAGALAPASKIRSRITPVGRVSIQGVWFEQRAWEPPRPCPIVSTGPLFLRKCTTSTGNFARPAVVGFVPSKSSNRHVRRRLLSEAVSRCSRRPVRPISNLNFL